VLEMTKENFVDALSEILNGNSEQVIQFDVLNLVMEMAKIEKSDEGKVIHVPEGVQAISGLLLSDWDEVQTSSILLLEELLKFESHNKTISKMQKLVAFGDGFKKVFFIEIFLFLNF